MTRSLLFAPANRPDMLRKLPRFAPDGVVLDLEDAVAPSSKDEARAHAREVGEELATEHPRLDVWVRVNAVPTGWFVDDLRRGLPKGVAGVVVPKLESSAQVSSVLVELASAGHADLPILAGIETVAGVLNSREILAQPQVSACYFGAEDYTADLGGQRRSDNLEVLWPRSQVAAVARLCGAWAFDQVVTDFNDREGFAADAALGRALGYRGKLCIHPGQVAWAHEAFTPSEAERAHARRMLAAYDAAVATGRAAIAFEGQMIDEPLARRARVLLGDCE